MELVLETQEQIKRRKKGMGSKNHSILQLNLILELSIKYRKVYRFIPELSLDIEGNEKIPDVSIYKQIKATPGKDETRMKDLPLGVIEILSPTQSLTELVVKARTYFDAGILSYWLVAPDVRTIYVYSDSDTNRVYTHRDTLIDEKLGLELPLMTLFE